MSQVERSVENLKKCNCMKCPTYKMGCKLKNMPKNMMTKMKGNISEVEHFEGMFCAFEKSHCITEITECICEACELSKENNLPNYAYCTITGGKKSHMAETS